MSVADFFRGQKAKAERAFRDSAEDALRAGFDAVALAKSRIQLSGEDFNGNKFEAYVPDYTEVRRKGGYQVSHVDLTVTGKGWASVIPVIVSVSNNEIVVSIKSNNAADQAKFNGQEKKRGNVFANSQEEQGIILRAFNQALTERLQ